MSAESVEAAPQLEPRPEVDPEQLQAAWVRFKALSRQVDLPEKVPDGWWPPGSPLAVNAAAAGIVPAINEALAQLPYPPTPGDVITVLATYLTRLAIPTGLSEHELRTFLFRMTQAEYARQQQQKRIIIAGTLPKNGKH